MGTVAIPLTQGKTAFIDEEDWLFVSPYTWHAAWRDDRWYAASGTIKRTAGEFLYLHRLIMAAGPDEVVDHKDNDGLNCRRSNMRVCTNAQNRMNTHTRTGISKYKGVCLNKKNAHRQWQARISVNDCGVFLGNWQTEEEAARAYNAAAIQHYGEFANLNVIDGLSYEESITAPIRILQRRGQDRTIRKRRADRIATEEAVAEMHALRAAGWTTQKIGDKFGLNRGNISRLLKPKPTAP